MNGRCRRLCFALAGLVALGLWVPPAVAAAQDVDSEREAWYFRYRQPLDEGGVEDPSGPGGPVEIARTTAQVPPPYPAETLHVGVNGGQPQARTFIDLATEALGQRGDLTSASVRIEDAGSDAGSRSVAAARMTICLVTAFVVDAQGGRWSNQPDAECEVSAPLELEPDSEPAVWTADLAPLVAAWQAGGSTQRAFAIMEAQGEEAAADTWHVALRGHQHEGGSSITTTITYRPADSSGSDLAPRQQTDSGSAVRTEDGDRGRQVSEPVSEPPPVVSGAPPFERSDQPADEAEFAVAPPETAARAGGGAQVPVTSTGWRSSLSALDNQMHSSTLLVPLLAVGLAALAGASLTSGSGATTTHAPAHQAGGAATRLMARYAARSRPDAALGTPTHVNSMEDDA